MMIELLSALPFIIMILLFGISNGLLILLKGLKRMIQFGKNKQRIKQRRLRKHE